MKSATLKGLCPGACDCDAAELFQSSDPGLPSFVGQPWAVLHNPYGVFLGSVSRRRVTRRFASLKCPVQKPPTGIVLAKQPEALAGGCFNAIVIALDVGPAPPAGIDSFRPPTVRNDVLRPVPVKSDRW